MSSLESIVWFSFIHLSKLYQVYTVGRNCAKCWGREMKDTAFQEFLVEGSQACNQIIAIPCSEKGEHRM